MNDKPTLFYFHDPMCSWCWAFKPQWDQLREKALNLIKVEMVLGGLAPDTDQAMPEAQQEMIQGYWRKIQALHNTPFNFDFWTQCQPRRSTWIACRAVIVAKDYGQEEAMNTAIQQAYYQRALNPSDAETLIQLATEIGIDAEEFAEQLNNETTQQTLQQHMEFGQACGVSGFPSLRLLKDQTAYEVPIAIDDYQVSLEAVESVLNNSDV